MRHTLEALSDPSTANVADLKLRIEEMLRIKVRISIATFAPGIIKNV